MATATPASQVGTVVSLIGGSLCQVYIHIRLAPPRSLLANLPYAWVRSRCCSCCCSCFDFSSGMTSGSVSFSTSAPTSAPCLASLVVTFHLYFGIIPMTPLIVFRENGNKLEACPTPETKNQRQLVACSNWEARRRISQAWGIMRSSRSSRVLQYLDRYSLSATHLVTRL